MKMTKSLGLALSAAMVGTALGCSSAVPSASTTETTVIPKAASIVEGSLAPDQLLKNDRQIMVNGQAMTFDQVRKMLPARISAAEASKMLVKIDESKVVDVKSMETQQWRGRGFYGRGIGRGFGLGWGRGFYGGYGGLYGGYGAGLWGGYGGLGCGYGGFSYLGLGGYYFPYYPIGAYYYPYIYPYGGLSYAPYMYGYGGGLYPYSYCW